MRAVVTGASGMLGNQVLRQLQQRAKDKRDPLYGAYVEGWSHVTPKAGGLTFRTREQGIQASTDGADLVIHCAAITDADYCEGHPSEAEHVNAKWPGALAKGIPRFIYISTDAVYNDSKSGRRKEDEQPNPKSVYAKTKLEGEGRVLAAHPEALVVRTTMFGWTLKTASRPKFVEQILASLTARKKQLLFKDAYFSPLHVEQLAETLLELAALDVSGVLNVGARHPISKYEFGRELAWTFGLDDSFIEEASVDDVALPARRTKNVGLDVSTFTRLMGLPPTVDHGIAQLYREVFDGTAKKVRGRTTYP